MGWTARSDATRPSPLPGFAAPPAPPPGPNRQGSLDDLGTPLAEVTFVVVDLETTGGSPAECSITEIGALKLRGGECLGTFETLVNPGVPIPPLITVLTGITEAMVLPAPRVDEVLPAFLEFLGGAVIVGHNVRFDVSFLDAALRARGEAPLANRRIDTMALARRLVRDEVPNLKLQTLARHFRTSREPCHRAFADAAATGEVLHGLLERAGTLGVLGLDDLLALPSIRAHPSASKLRLTARLPREPGVYVMRDAGGRVLYVGKATNLRARVRSYFSGDDRRKVPQLLRETATIDHLVCRSPLEAAVREVRLVQRWQPRFNRQLKAWRGYAYVKLTSERFPRLAVARVARPDGATYLGPLHSAGAARLVIEAIETAVPLRRCPARLGRGHRPDPGPPCTPAQLGVATCPCRGQIDERDYAALVERVRRGLGPEPALLLDPLATRMQALAEAERFEEAGATRDRLLALERALDRQRAVDGLRRVERLVVATPEGRVELRRGRLILDGGPGTETLPGLDSDDDDHQDDGDRRGGSRETGEDRPVGRTDLDELVVVARWLRDQAGALRPVEVEGTFVSPLPGLPGWNRRTRAERAPNRSAADREPSAAGAVAAKR